MIRSSEIASLVQDGFSREEIDEIYIAAVARRRGEPSPATATG